jgi:hypothetical protein
MLDLFVTRVQATVEELKRTVDPEPLSRLKRVLYVLALEHENWIRSLLDQNPALFTHMQAHAPHSELPSSSAVALQHVPENAGTCK